MNNRILITGANGFLGKAFLKSTTALAAEVLPLGGRLRASKGAPCLDITDKASIRAVLREFRPTHVLNFAARGVTRDQSTMLDLLAVNTVGALNILEGLIEEGLSPHTFFFGTAYEYADSKQRLDEKSTLDPKSPYAISKTTLYYTIKQYQSIVPLTFLRLFNIFGIGEPADRLIPFIVRKSIANEDISLTNGEQLRDFMFIDDLILILDRLIAKPVPGQSGFLTLNVGTGKGISLKSFIGHVSNALQRRKLVPELKFGALPYRLQDPMCCVADNTKLLSLFGDIAFTDLQVAVEKTVEAIYDC